MNDLDKLKLQLSQTTRNHADNKTQIGAPSNRDGLGKRVQLMQRNKTICCEVE